MNNQAMGSGLTRYRSAPSSYFASLLDGPNFGSDDFERLFNPRASSPETQIIFSRFMNSGETEIEAAPTKTEPCEIELQSNDYSLFPQSDDNNNCDSDKRAAQNKIQRFGTGPNDSPLIRHSSSPAGLFANINIDEFGTVRAIGDGNITEASSFCSSSSSSRSRNSRTTFKMDPITEIETKPWDDNNDFPINSWDDNNDFLKGRLDHQKHEGGNPATTRLSHHLSLPKNFGELSSMEKLLQDSVPCKIRAKRGCATHPRSIAERVRRTKISERMRKLQELVPNMEKQTNTSDMLDLAVEYIKDLQEQLKTLSDDREKCSCEAKLGS